jgi:hypothetical protein
MDKRKFVITLILVLTQACAPRHTVNIDVENKHSALLSMVMQEADFELKTSWEAEEVTQKSYNANNSNGWLAEIASRGMIGGVGKGHLIIIHNRLSRYDKVVDWDVPFKSSQESDGIVVVDMPNLGNKRRNQCFTSELVVRCEVIVQYDRIVSQLWLQGPSDLTVDTIVNIIVPIIKKIDNRISQN